MLANSKGHYLIQRFGWVAALGKIPDTKRAGHFLKNDMASADRSARQIKALKPVAELLKPKKDQTYAEAGEKLMARVASHARRDEKLRLVLENLHDVRGENAPRAQPVVLEGSFVGRPGKEDREN